MQSWSDDPTASPRLQMRARIVLKAEEGKTNQSIAQELGVSPGTVGLWRRRFAVHGLEGIRLLAPHSARPTPERRDKAELILRATQEAPPPDRLRWTTRTLARYLGLNHMQVYRVWKDYSVFSGLPAGPARASTLGPWVDLLGTFQCPPVRAVVFGIDEGGHPHPSGRDESPDSLPKVIYVPATGTTDLAWTIEGLRTMVPERKVSVAGPFDLLIFLRAIEQRFGTGLGRHLIAACPSGHEQGRLRHWLSRRPGFSSEIVQDAPAWQSAVGRFLRSWGSGPLAAGSFRSIAPLTTALLRLAGDRSSPSVAFSWSAR